jgi:hypothetical protein
MSTEIGDRLPESVVLAFDGERLREKIGLGYLLVTADPDGTPRPCMLSCGEVLAVDDRRLRMALWAGTHSSANLSRGAPCFFCYIAPGSVLYVNGTPSNIGALEQHHVECYDLLVSSVQSDDHPGMPASDTFRFVVTDRSVDSVASEWEERLWAMRSL